MRRLDRSKALDANVPDDGAVGAEDLNSTAQSRYARAPVLDCLVNEAPRHEVIFGCKRLALTLTVQPPLELPEGLAVLPLEALTLLFVPGQLARCAEKRNLAKRRLRRLETEILEDSGDEFRSARHASVSLSVRFLVVWSDCGCKPIRRVTNDIYLQDPQPRRSHANKASCGCGPGGDDQKTPEEIAEEWIDVAQKSNSEVLDLHGLGLLELPPSIG
ncbi:MAG TPA: hypothetical protein VL403_16805 [Candidatus Kryptonia bacterium]|nr:hypothetical protein [Candidatus Kryptonia bacterium]